MIGEILEIRELVICLQNPNMHIVHVIEVHYGQTFYESLSHQFFCQMLPILAPTNKDDKQGWGQGQLVCLAYISESQKLLAPSL